MFGMEPVFERVWRGTRKGCYERYMFSANEVYTYEEWNRRYNNDEDGNCDTIRPIPPRTMFKFYGNYFCGLTGGKPYAIVERVDPETGECPEGLEPCSNKTSAENTVCYPPEEHATSCPITDLKIIEVDQAA